MKQLASTFFILLVTISISSCSSLSPYKVPVLQGNIFEDEDLELCLVQRRHIQILFELPDVDCY